MVAHCVHPIMAILYLDLCLVRDFGDSIDFFFVFGAAAGTLPGNQMRFEVALRCMGMNPVLSRPRHNIKICSL
jgi:hypothetical protein